MAGFARQVIYPLAAVALALVLGGGPFLTSQCATRCAHAAAGAGGQPHAVHHDECPDAPGGGPVVAPTPPPHRCQASVLNGAVAGQLDFSPIPVLWSTPFRGQSVVDRSASLLHVESRHGPRGSPPTTAPLRI